MKKLFNYLIQRQSKNYEHYYHNNNRYNQDQIRLNQVENCMVHITISQAMQETELETMSLM